ncbi:hypothetical protein ACFPFP_38630 [Bradyrhizobium sp. GCM10023182]|uniref:Uncharacterized protein n=1 Tax=Bradyrhizobium zhengyangense TaxID=2911009 RepID=A0ABS9M0N3_9BRAD|nr:hypothetical protein [Bradyrhizobium zhengyangense]MCG2672826.1 hypothetical protein [Bradyrhizobium zhengyangense]
MLDWLPDQLRVVRLTHPKYTARALQQGDANGRTGTGASWWLATPVLLACNQQILRSSVLLTAADSRLLRCRSLPSDARWLVGGACWTLEGLRESQCKTVFGARFICSLMTCRSP